ncbi:Ger(x)C family spore germination protein [Cohnella terricola]|uniref:Ger(X)C family spore germination protein n=2 Tax=Cohnella terricola TaxID=1289167 RepID=A0A559JR62_9BACL|nr:Ger(x)C family spore germination protein [Cohnella terricola]
MLLTAGCWDNHELDEYGFVQAVAIDRTEADQIQLTTHFYNPSGKTEMSGGSKSSAKGINIRTSGDTIFEAIRDIPTRFGRKAKWDHMRVILIGERLARTQNIREILDYFSRDHEPRGTVLPLVTEGSAEDYLKIKPFIEQTIGQQYKKMESNGALYSAKTSNIPLYELAIHLKSPSNTSDIPYIHKSPSGKEAIVSRIAVIKGSKLVHILEEKDTEAYLMLVDKYQSGILEFPCMGSAQGQVNNKESLEVVSFKSNLGPRVNGNDVTVGVKIEIKGTIGELRCSRLKSVEDTKRFERRIADQVQARLEHAISIFKAQKLDVIGIGDRLYRRNLQQWKRLEPNWDERFAQSRYDIRVNVQVLNTGMNVGTPFG